MPDKRLVIEAVSIEAIGQSAQQALAGAELPEPPGKDPVPQATVALYSNGRHHDTPVYQRDTLHPGAHLQGPAIICDANGTTIIEPEWQVRILGGGELMLSRAVPKAGRRAMGTDVDPIMLEIYIGRASWRERGWQYV